MQFAGIWGIYGLSFFVIFANGILFYILASKDVLGRISRCANGLKSGVSTELKPQNWTILTSLESGIGEVLKRIKWDAFLCKLKFKFLKSWGGWFGLIAIPYLYGYLVLDSSLLKTDQRQMESTISVGLVQTGLLPSQKTPLPRKADHFIPLMDQWKRILLSLQAADKEWDLIVFPEVTVPMFANCYIYPYEVVLSELKEIYGKDLTRCLPPLQAPYAEVQFVGGKAILCVSNAFFAQIIANQYHAEIAVGLDHYDSISNKYYNSAFYFTPSGDKAERYDKQVLLPLAEYLPFKWLESLTRRYGISDFFSHGKQACVLGKRVLFSPSICYEETFPHLIRSGRLMGANLLINLTNDSYYPFSKLPEQHFSHARVRAVENGVFLIRACNTGITAVVDRFGREVARFGSRKKESEVMRGVLTVAIAQQSHQTPYLFWGDFGIVGIALVVLSAFLFFQIKTLISGSVIRDLAQLKVRRLKEP
jgi:apolipoprotein N-acyltransferase